jgi:hypothetical protein
MRQRKKGGLGGKLACGATRWRGLRSPAAAEIRETPLEAPGILAVDVSQSDS